MSKKVVRSFRLSDETYNSLVEEAEKRRVSVNWLVDEICESFLGYDRLLSRSGMVKVWAEVFLTLIERATTKTIREAARIAAENSKTAIVSGSGELTLHGVLDFFALAARRNGFQFTKMQESEKLKIVVYYRQYSDPNARLFFELMWKDLFESVCSKVSFSTLGEDIMIEALPGKKSGISGLQTTREKDELVSSKKEPTFLP